MKLPGNLPLGKNQAVYPEQYTQSLLCPVPRAEGRKELGSVEAFLGFDRWTGYELSWLSPQGVPEVAIVEFDFPADSVYLIESKSLKLYLGSFNQTKITRDDLVHTLITDLTEASEGQVQVSLFDVDQYPVFNDKGYALLDAGDLVCSEYEVNPALLRNRAGEATKEYLKTHIFRSLCPVTAQPDWASVYIGYQGKPIDHQSLLAYLISFRKHQGFHEQCVEMIYRDIMTHCKPSELTVYARFLRRGGLDINPVRYSHTVNPESFRRVARQ